MSAEFVHDDYELQRLWHAANPGVTPTPWDTPVARPLIYVVLPQPDDPPEPIDLAAYRRRRRP